MTKCKKITLSIMLLFIAATLTIGIYFAFSNPVDRIKPLSADEEAKIYADIKQKYPYSDPIKRYYGKYNGYYVFLTSDESEFSGPNCMTIGNNKFTHNRSFSIIAYNQELNNLYYLYQDGILTKKQIKRIYDIHREYEGTRLNPISEFFINLSHSIKSPIERVKPLSEEKTQEINSAFFNKYGDEFHSYRYYGEYNGCYVFFRSGIADATETKLIAGCYFYHTKLFNLYAYKDGVFYNLDAAYEKGLITQKQVEKVMYVHDEYAELERNKNKINQN